MVATHCTHDTSLQRSTPMSDSQTSTTLPPFRDLEVDKVPNAWMLTYWLPDDVALRLKIEHGSITDPDAFIAEIRLGPNNEFQRINEFDLAPCVIAEPGWPEEEVADSWDELPNIYTAEF